MKPERLYAPAVLGLLAAGGLAWFAARRPWAVTTVGDGSVPGSTIETTGAEALGLPVALAIVVAAAGLAVLATSRRVRQGVGVVVALIAVAGLVTTTLSLASEIEQAVHTSPALVDPEAGFSTDATIWRYVTALAFIAALGLAAVVIRWGGRWPRMSSRYEAPGRPSSGVVHEADMWKALDDGDDPTQ